MHTTSMLPDAVLQERKALLDQGLEKLREQGFRNMRAHDVPGCEEPEELLIPVLNVHARPDITAEPADGNGAALAVVEVSSGLGEESCGRRWQVLAHWAQEHGGTFRIFVHPEDQQRAQAIAEQWHLPVELVTSLARH
ncbi:MAG: hypothetical protein WCC36_14165 [Gammaproteobacteria bacterium]